MDNLEYLKTQTSSLINLYNAKHYEEAISKAKILIKKFLINCYFIMLYPYLFSIGKDEEALKFYLKL